MGLKKFENFEKNNPEATFNVEFLHGIMNKPELIRNVYLFLKDLHRRTFTSWQNIVDGHICGKYSSFINFLS